MFETCKLIRSIGIIGDAFDEAVLTAAPNGTSKSKLDTLHGPWRTCRQLILAILEWIDCYDHHQLNSEIGDIPPAEQESNRYCQQDLVTKIENPEADTSPILGHFSPLRKLDYLVFKNLAFHFIFDPIANIVNTIGRSNNIGLTITISPTKKTTPNIMTIVLSDITEPLICSC